jgi:hypothetical protein
VTEGKNKIFFCLSPNIFQFTPLNRKRPTLVPVLQVTRHYMTNKPRVVKDYEKLDPEIQEQIKLTYPYGFAKHLIQYKNADGKFVSALPLETDDRYYLVRMTPFEAKQIVEEDEDYDESGELKESVKEEYEEKYGDLDYLTITEGEGDSSDDEEE